MRSRIVIAALVLGLLLLAAAPMANARDEGIETCVAVSCGAGLVPAGGAVGAVSQALVQMCAGAGDGLMVYPARVCGQAAIECETRTTVAGVDGVASIGAHSVGCGADGFDTVVVSLVR